MKELLFLLCTVVIILLGTTICYTTDKYIESIQNIYSMKKDGYEILDTIVNDFQLLCNEKNDFPNSNAIQQINQKYSKYNFVIDDISSGINLRTFPKSITENTQIKLFLQNTPEEEVFYGWYNKKLLQSSFNITDNYLINDMNLVNINYLSEDCLRIILQSLNISEQRILVFIKLWKDSKIKNEEDICKALNISKDNKIFCVLGFKTSFWKVSFLYKDRCKVIGILSAIPIDRKIEKYILEERYFELL